MNYDVCYNNTFTSTDEIIWAKLLQVDPAVIKHTKLNNKQVYKLSKPLPFGDYLVMVQQNGPNAWPTWKIVSQKDLKKARVR
ncbi:MAG: hypothetical protein R2750_00520 [Bacteroidales bacterium]